jgi:hypothetical protein
MSLHEILAAASRARTLATDLERSDREVDRHQVAAGVRHELDTVLRLARVELERLEAAATQDMPGKVRTDAPGTSRVAAQAITLKTGSDRWRILEALWFAGSTGLTDLELQMALAVDGRSMNPSTERPRRGELVDANLVWGSGSRVHGDHQWTVWVLTQAGADAYRERVPGPPRVVTHEGDPTLFGS